MSTEHTTSMNPSLTRRNLAAVAGLLMCGHLLSHSQLCWAASTQPSTTSLGLRVEDFGFKWTPGGALELKGKAADILLNGIPISARTWGWISAAMATGFVAQIGLTIIPPIISALSKNGESLESVVNQLVAKIRDVIREELTYFRDKQYKQDFQSVSELFGQLRANPNDMALIAQLVSRASTCATNLELTGYPGYELYCIARSMQMSIQQQYSKAHNLPGDRARLGYEPIIGGFRKHSLSLLNDVIMRFEPNWVVRNIPSNDYKTANWQNRIYGVGNDDAIKVVVLDKYPYFDQLITGRFLLWNNNSLQSMPNSEVADFHLDVIRRDYPTVWQSLNATSLPILKLAQVRERFLGKVNVGDALLKSWDSGHGIGS